MELLLSKYLRSVFDRGVLRLWALQPKMCRELNAVIFCGRLADRFRCKQRGHEPEGYDIRGATQMTLRAPRCGSGPNCPLEVPPIPPIAAGGPFPQAPALLSPPPTSLFPPPP